MDGLRKNGKVSPQSRVEQTLKRLGLEINALVSFTSLCGIVDCRHEYLFRNLLTLQNLQNGNWMVCSLM